MVAGVGAHVQRCGAVPPDRCPCHDDHDSAGRPTDTGTTARVMRDGPGGSERAIADDEVEALDAGAGVTSGTTITLAPPVTHEIDGSTPAEIERNASGSLSAGHVEVDIEHDATTTNGRVDAAHVTVTMTKHTYTWGEGREQATPAHRTIIDRFFTLINAHEERHIARNRRAYRNAHAGMLRKTPERAQAALDAVECAAGQRDEALDAAEGCVRFTTNHADAELVGLADCGFEAADYTSHLDCD